MTRFVSRIGTDKVSDAMLEMMQGAQIDTSFIGRSHERSVGLYLISLNNGERSFSYWRDTSAAKQLARDPDVLDAALEDADLIYISGITLAILDRLGRETLFSALRAARRKGCLIAFDSNLRPRLWQSLSEMCELVSQAASVCDLVLPSFDDEAAFVDDKTPEATIARYMDQGVASVTVKNGDGAIHNTCRDEVGVYQPPKVAQVIDLTAAGDSFNARIFTRMDRAQAVEQLLVSASYITAQVIGKSVPRVCRGYTIVGTIGTCSVVRPEG